MRKTKEKSVSVIAIQILTPAKEQEIRTNFENAILEETQKACQKKKKLSPYRCLLTMETTKFYESNFFKDYLKELESRGIEHHTTEWKVGLTRIPQKVALTNLAWLIEGESRCS